MAGVGGTLSLFAGCTGGGDGSSGGDGGLEDGSSSGGSATHGGVTVAVEYHVLTTSIVDQNEAGEACIEPVETDMTPLVTVVQVDAEGAESEVSPHGIVESARLLCAGESHELRSLAAVPTDSPSVDRFEIGFNVPENADPSSCELEMMWQGDGAHEESFRFDLGPEQEPNISEEIPRCDIEELRESFAVRVEMGNEEHDLFEVEDVAMVGQVEETNGHYRLPIRLSDEGIARVEERLRDAGVIDNPGEVRILVELEGEVVMDLGMSPELAEQIDKGEWDGQLLLLFDDRETVERVRDILTGGHNGE